MEVRCVNTQMQVLREPDGQEHSSDSSRADFLFKVYASRLPRLPHIRTCQRALVLSRPIWPEATFRNC